MPKPAQFKFKALKAFTRTKHGGEPTFGKRKLARPIATKTSMHLVLRSSIARREHSMLSPRHRDRVTAIIWGAAEKNHVEIQQFANAGNHLHLLVRAKARQGFKAFLRTITGMIARVITGAVKGRPFGKFWDHLAFSRIVTPGRDYKTTLAYVFQNTKEALGIPTKRKPNPSFRALLLGFD